MIVCADDYGLHEDVDEAVLELCEHGSLTAVSCLAVLQRCTGEAFRALQKHGAAVDIGLHLCLTDEGLPLEPRSMQTLPNFGSLLRRGWLKQLNPRDIAHEIQRQYDHFVAKSGRPPDHIDGHLHVHQLPGIREGLLEFMSRLPASSRPYVRNTRMSIRDLRRLGLPWLKAGIIGALGKAMEVRLATAGIRTNRGFAGVYDFRKWTRYPEYFPRFTAALDKPNGILVVHPGLKEDWRKQEFETLRRFAPNDARRNRFT